MPSVLRSRPTRSPQGNSDDVLLALALGFATVLFAFEWNGEPRYVPDPGRPPAHNPPAADARGAAQSGPDAWSVGQGIEAGQASRKD